MNLDQVEPRDVVDLPSALADLLDRPALTLNPTPERTTR